MLTQLEQPQTAAAGTMPVNMPPGQPPAAAESDADSSREARVFASSRPPGVAEAATPPAAPASSNEAGATSSKAYSEALRSSQSIQSGKKQPEKRAKGGPPPPPPPADAALQPAAPAVPQTMRQRRAGRRATTPGATRPRIRNSVCGKCRSLGETKDAPPAAPRAPSSTPAPKQRATQAGASLGRRPEYANRNKFVVKEELAIAELTNRSPPDIRAKAELGDHFEI